MPPPSLSTTTMVRSTPRPRSAEQAVACRAGTRRRRSAATGRPRRGPSATPTAVDTTPSMPLAPRLASTRTPVARRAVPLDVADRHRRRHHERRRRRAAAAARPGRRPARWARRARPAPSSMAAAPPPRPPPTRRQPRSARGSTRRPASASRRPARSAIGDAAPPRRRGRGRPRRRRASTSDLLGAATRPATGRAPSTPAGAPRRSTTSGRCRRRSRRARSRASKCGDRRRRGDPAARLRGSASTGHPAAAASACTAVGVARPAAGHDHAPAAPSTRSSSARRSPGRRRRADHRPCHGPAVGRGPAAAARPRPPAARGTAG